MNLDAIGKAVAEAEDHYRNNPDPGPAADIPVTARIENGLRCRIESPDGNHVYTDMPEAVGGSATTGSPGWLMRAAVASCDATLLTMRAARLGLKLESVSVRFESSSDGRGMFLDEGISPASSDVRVFFRIEAPEVSRDQIKDLVQWVSEHAPVGNDLIQANRIEVIIEDD